METDDEALALRVMRDWRTAGLSAREEALCHFARKLTLEPGAMTPQDLEGLGAHDLDDGARLDLVQVVAYFNYINRVADGLGVDLEDFMRGDLPPGRPANPAG